MANTAASGSVETVNANVSGRSVEPPTTPPTKAPPTEEVTRFLCGDQREIKWGVSSSQRSQVFIDNTVETSIIYTDIINETIPSFELKDAEDNVVAKVESLSASAENPVSIFRYNRTSGATLVDGVTGANFDSEFSIPVFIRKTSSIDGKIKYEPLSNVYSPEISYNRFNNELILSYWQNIDPSAGVTISGVEGYNNDVAKDICKKKAKSSGSVSSVENKGGSVSTVYKTKNKDIERALMHTQGSPIGVTAMDDDSLPYDIVYIFNEPVEIIRKKGPVNDIKTNIGVSLITDNEDCENRPDRASVNNSTWVYDGDYCKHGDLDDLFKVDVWCRVSSSLKKESGSVETTYSKQLVLANAGRGNEWFLYFYSDPPGNNGRRTFRVVIPVLPNGQLDQNFIDNFQPPPDINWIGQRRTGNQELEKTGFDISQKDEGDTRLFLWINENLNYSPKETIKGGLVHRRSKEVTQKITGYNIPPNRRGFERWFEGVKEGEQNIGALIEAQKPSIDEIKCGMLRDVLHITDDHHLEVRTGAHFIYQDRQSGLPAEHLSGPVVFFPEEKFNLCEDNSITLSGKINEEYVSGTIGHKCTPYSGFFYWRECEYDDQDPTKSNKCKNNRVTNIDGSRNHEVPGVWHVTTEIPVFNWRYEPPHTRVYIPDTFDNRNPNAVVESFPARFPGSGNVPQGRNLPFFPTLHLEDETIDGMEISANASDLGGAIAVATTRKQNEQGKAGKKVTAGEKYFLEANQKKIKKPTAGRGARGKTPTVKKTPQAVSGDTKLLDGWKGNFGFDATGALAFAIANAQNRMGTIKNNLPNGKLPSQQINDFNSDSEITGVRVNSEFGVNSRGEITEIKTGKANVDDPDFGKVITEAKDEVDNTYLSKVIKFDTGKVDMNGLPIINERLVYVSELGPPFYLDPETLEIIDNQGNTIKDGIPGKPKKAGRLKPVVDAAGNVTFLIVKNERELGEVEGEKKTLINGELVGGEIIGELGSRQAGIEYEGDNHKGQLSPDIEFLHSSFFTKQYLLNADPEFSSLLQSVQGLSSGIIGSSLSLPIDKLPNEQTVLHSLSKHGTIKNENDSDLIVNTAFITPLPKEYAGKRGIARRLDNSWLGTEISLIAGVTSVSLQHNIGLGVGVAGSGMIAHAVPILQGLNVYKKEGPEGSLLDEEKSVRPEGVVGINPNVFEEKHYGGSNRIFTSKGESFVLTTIGINVSSLSYELALKNNHVNIESAREIRRIAQEYLNNSAELFRNLINLYFRQVTLDWWDTQVYLIGDLEFEDFTSLDKLFYDDIVEMTSVGVDIGGNRYTKLVVPSNGVRNTFSFLTSELVRDFIDLETGRPKFPGTHKVVLSPETKSIVFSESSGSSISENVSNEEERIKDIYGIVNRNYAQESVQNVIGGTLVGLSNEKETVEDPHPDHPVVSPSTILEDGITLEEGFDTINTILTVLSARTAHLEQKPNGVLLATVNEALPNGKYNCLIDNTTQVFLDVVSGDNFNLQPGDKVWIVRAMNDDTFVAFRQPTTKTPAEYVDTTAIVDERIQTPAALDQIDTDDTENQQDLNIKLIKCFNAAVQAVVAEKMTFSPRFGVVTTTAPNNTVNNTVSIQENLVLGTARFLATTNKNTTQDITVVLELILPNRFQAWSATSPMQFLNMVTGGAAIDVRVTDCLGVPDVTSESLTNLALTDSIIGAVGSPTELTGTYFPNGFVRIDFTFFVKKGEQADLGRAEFNFGTV